MKTKAKATKKAPATTKAVTVVTTDLAPVVAPEVAPEVVTEVTEVEAAPKATLDVGQKIYLKGFIASPAEGFRTQNEVLKVVEIVDHFKVGATEADECYRLQSLKGRKTTSSLYLARIGETWSYHYRTASVRHNWKAPVWEPLA